MNSAHYFPMENFQEIIKERDIRVPLHLLHADVNLS